MFEVLFFIFFQNVRVQKCTFIHYYYECYEYEYGIHFILYGTGMFDECSRPDYVFLTKLTSIAYCHGINVMF